MNKIILGDQQKEALELIKQFFKSNKKVFSLVGYAGTGKSTMIKQIIDYLEHEYRRYVLCAPTHKAKSIVMLNTERDAYTVHQILKLSPILDIMELDLRNVVFTQGSTTKDLAEIPTNGVLICDESSMINDYIYNLLLERCSFFNCKILFVGDKAQLKPVNEALHSLVFSVEDNYELTHIYRQREENGLSEILPVLRESPIGRFKDSIGINGGLHCYNTAKDLFMAAIPDFRKAIQDKDIFQSKLLAYTNRRVEALNKKMRSVLFPGDEQYYPGEFLTCYENLEFGFQSYWNSMDYVVTAPPVKRDIKIPFFTPVPGYAITLYDIGNDCEGDVFILDKNIPEMYINSLSHLIEETRLTAIDLKRRKARGSGLAWRKYFDIMDSFTTPFNFYYDNRVIKKKTFDYGYACTIHRSQGSSINNVFIDMKDIAICRDLIELRQLQYVSVSRAKTNAHILQ